jgi:hypothetical protein
MYGKTAITCFKYQGVPVWFRSLHIFGYNTGVVAVLAL